MSNKRTFEKITDSQARKASIETLSDRPNKTSHFGEGGLSAQQLKQRFDALPELSRKKINEIIAAFNTVEGAKYIGIDAADQDNLYDFLALFKAAERNGKNITDYIEILHEPIVGGKETSTSIKDIINEVCSVLISDKTVIDEINVRSNENRSGIEALSDNLSKQGERIAGIERYLSGENFVIDDTMAYEKKVPSNACEKAKILSIGGMTYKKKTDEGNLMPYPYISGDFNSNKNGAVTVSGNGEVVITLGDGTVYPAGSYIFDVGESGISGLNVEFSNYTTKPTFTRRENYKYLIASEGSFCITKYSAILDYADIGITLYPMFYKSDTPITWQPRGEYLSNTKVKAIESKGANEFTYRARIFSNYQYISAYMVFTFDGLIPNSPYTISLVNGYKGNAESHTEKYVNLSNKSFEPINSGALGWLVHPSETYCSALQTVTSSADGKLYLRLYGYNDQTQLSELFSICTNIMLNSGESALSYTPYGTLDTFTIPETVQALEGYGLGLEGYPNTVEYANGRVKLDKRVKMGVVSKIAHVYWADYSNVEFYAFNMPSDYIGYKTDAFMLEGFNKKPSHTNWDSADFIGVATGLATEYEVWVGFPKGTIQTEAEAALLGKSFVYALATPEVTDITDLMPKENLIKVLGGCRIAAVNEHSDPVPFSIKYLITYQREDA